MHLRNRCAAILAAVLLIPLFSAVSTLLAPGSAMAADLSARGPSAVADKFGNQYIFWRSRSGQLEAGFYNFYTRSWSAPVNLKMGSIGSEPTAAAAPGQVIEHGSRAFSWIYVYWESASPKHNLRYAYFGSKGWKGPFSVSSGALGSQPSASGNTVAGRQEIDIYWKGQNGQLWSTHSSSSPWVAREYARPRQASFRGKGFGKLGSSPAASAARGNCVAGACSFDDTVVWRGGNGGLWDASYSTLSHSWDAGPSQVKSAKKLGSPPSIAMETTFGSIDIVWQGAQGGRDLWYLAGGSNNPLAVGFGPLGSAPAVVWSAATGKLTDDQLFVYWTDSARHLWEAHLDRTGWHHFRVKKLGTL